MRKRKNKFDTSKVDVEDMLDALGMENLKWATEEEMNFSCPFPGHTHGDQNPSAYMNGGTTAWMCQGCKRKGNAVTFLAELEGISVLEAVQFLRERYGGSAPDPDSYPLRDEIARHYAKRRREEEARVVNDEPIDEALIDNFAVNWTNPFLQNFSPDWAKYILERGFSTETLDEWQIGYAAEYNRLSIPVRDHNGVLVGFKGRAYREGHEPKYLVLGKDQWPRYHVSLNAFGLHRVEPSVESGGMDLIVVEGELNVIALWQMGIRNVVGVNGSNFSERQGQLLRAKAESVVVFFDSDNAGNEGVILLCEQLRDHMPVFVVPDHDFDAADCIHPEKEVDESSVRELLYGAMSETKIRVASRLEVR